MSRQSLNLYAVLNQGILNQKTYVQIPVSKKLIAMLYFLRQQGFIGDFKIITRVLGKKTNTCFSVSLVYTSEGRTALSNICPISKPRRRIFVSLLQLKRLRRSTILLVISTTYGLLTDSEAIHKGVGGELLCIIS